MRRVLEATAAVLVLSGGWPRRPTTRHRAGTTAGSPYPRSTGRPSRSRSATRRSRSPAGTSGRPSCGPRSSTTEPSSPSTAATVDITRESDGATIDELDISGAGWDLVSEDGTEVLIELEGPSLVWAGNDVERAAADEAGLPYLSYYEEGTVLLRVEVDPETGETLAADTLRTTVADEDEVDLCDVLDEAADSGDSHDDSGHGKRDG